MSNIRVEVQSEEGTTTDPARVKIYDDEVLIAEVIGTVEPKKGADGKLYPCVTLRKKEEGKVMLSAKMVLHHDDPLCKARLENGFCLACNLWPDMQSTCFYFYCPACDLLLINLKCSNCGEIFKRPTK